MPQTPVDPDAGPAHASPSLLLLVLLGGALGAPLRYALSLAVPQGSGAFPTATFVTNVAGAALLGLLLEGLAGPGPESVARRAARLALGTGLLGAFTTYSALAVEVALLARDGHDRLAAGYALVSVAAGLAAAAAGVLLATGVRRALGA